MCVRADVNLSALIESTDDLVWSVDLDHRLTAFNRAFRNHVRATFGTPPELGMYARDFLPPERAGLIPPLYERVPAEGSFRIEFSLADGRHLDLSLGPILVNGEMTGVSVFGKDITKQKAAEKALREAESKFRAIFDGALEGFYQTTLEGKSLSANPAFARMLGHDSPEDLIATVHDAGRDLWMDPDERERFARRLEEQGTIRGYECRFKQKDGSPIWVSLNCRRVLNSDGRAPYHEGFIFDASERKRTEETLRENGDFLKEAQRIGALGCYVLDISTGVWTSTSPLDELFGIDESYKRTVTGWTALIHPDDRAMIAAYFSDEVVGERRPFDKEYRIVRPADHAERWVHGMGRLEFDAQGRPRKMSGIIRDITNHKRAETQIHDSEERYRATFEQVAVGILHSSLKGQIMMCNQRFADIIGYPLEEVPSLTFQQITVADDLGDSVAVLKQMLNDATLTSSWEKRYIRKDGSLTWVKITVSTLRDRSGRAQHFVTVVEDINARRAAEDRLSAAQEALRLSEELYRTAFQTHLDSININRLSDGKYIDVNQSFLDTTGYQREDVLGKTSLELGIWADPRDRQTMTEMVTQASNCRNLEVQFRKKNGDVFWGQMSASAIEIDGVPCILAITRDISSAKLAESTIRDLAFYDTLTGLPNRRLLLDRLRLTLSGNTLEGHSQALLFIDLDNFKTLNETLGHLIGDLLLQEVARRIAVCAHEADTVCRLGSDEFVVMLEDLSKVPEEAAAQAEAVGEKILAAIGLPCLLEGRECLFTACIGITVFGNHRENTNGLIQQADIALYQAKAAGRNAMRFFSPDLQAAVNARAELEDDLRQAIKTEQFLLFYQPQMERGRLIGAEALIRWQHPKRGLVPPDEFIPRAEETSLILPLGEWVLETACHQIESWGGRKETAQLSIAVNISALQFRQPEFVEHVLAVLERTGADPKNLKLELTESMLVENFEEVIAKMTELKSHGLSFSLDDFGTGYSSLAYLKRLPLDQLKIDRAFVRDMMVDVTSGAIAQTIISLGRAMGLSVMAEGVETEEQRGFLAGMGCHAFQGYLFSRPLPMDAFQTFIEGLGEASAPLRK